MTTQDEYDKAEYRQTLRKMLGIPPGQTEEETPPWAQPSPVGLKDEEDSEVPPSQRTASIPSEESDERGLFEEETDDTGLTGNPNVRTDDELRRQYAELRRKEEGEESEEYNPSIPPHGHGLNPHARAALADDAEAAEEAMKAFNGIFSSIVSKYADPRNPTAVAYMRKEFDDAIKTVFQPHGTSTFTNLRTPGQPPAKLQAQPGRSGSNERGVQPHNPEPTGSGTVGSLKPYEYEGGYYTNPSRPGSPEHNLGQPNPNADSYLSVRTGDSDKPSAQPNAQPSRTGYFQGRGGHDTPSHPVASPGRSGIGPTKSFKPSLMKEFVAGQASETRERSEGNLPNNPHDTRGVVSTPPQYSEGIKAVFKGKGWIAEKMAHTGTETQVAFPDSSNDYAEGEEVVHTLRKTARDLLKKDMN